MLGDGRYFNVTSAGLDGTYTRFAHFGASARLVARHRRQPGRRSVPRDDAVAMAE